LEHSVSYLVIPSPLPRQHPWEEKQFPSRVGRKENNRLFSGHRLLSQRHLNKAGAGYLVQIMGYSLLGVTLGKMKRMRTKGGRSGTGFLP
jgi:hypothetical protein